ncbi:MAG: hypothetical protein ABSH20_12845 [Tepidisphaeraceae bacterium]|jgi:RNA polymerase sigma-70 factor (ECF subfamily)
MNGAEHNGMPVTRWSLIEQAGSSDPVVARRAMERLLTDYAPAIQDFLQGKGVKRQDAEDLVQGFIVDKILTHDLIQDASRPQGRFRSLLLTSLRRYLVDERRKASARKRSPAAQIVSLDYADDVAAAKDADEFDWAIIRQVITKTLARMKKRCEAEGQPALWAVFEARQVRPTKGEVADSYEHLQQELALTYSQATKANSKAPRIFTECLREVIGDYAGRENVEVELTWLRGFLRRAAKG